MNTKERFSFDVEFQQEILQFIVTDPKSGFKALDLLESDYFTLIPHILIAETLKKYYARKFLIPSFAVVKEEMRQLLRRKQWQDLVHSDDKEKAFKILKRVYVRPVRDPDTIYNKCRSFARYVALREEMEAVNLDDFESYEKYADKITKAIHKGTELNQRKSLLLLRDAKIRANRRLDEPGGQQTPWWQLNAATNSGGTTKGNIIIVLSEAKFFKTGFLVNTGLGYLKQGEVILYVDLENGEQAIATRADQGIQNKDRKSLLDPANIKPFLKMVRMYKRFGGEMAILRLPAGSLVSAIHKEIIRLKDEEGLVVKKIICDYPDLMSASDGASIEDKRISQVYIDLKTLAEEDDIDCIWAASHVNREGTREGKGKKYGHQHLAKASDKIRHADMVWALMQDEEEQEAGIMRMELVAQRDGLQIGRVWFWANLAKQKLKEFNKAQVKEMEEMYKEKHAKKPREGEERSLNKKKTSDI